MQYFDWDKEKNQKLRRDRNISFEEVKLAVTEGRLLETVDHPNQKCYPGQKIMVVEINNYAYLVPYVEEKEIFF